MGTSAKTLRRIVWLVEKGHLPIGGRVADIGTQQLRADPEAVGAFIDFFKRKGASILITQSEANRIGKAGYLGELLKAVGFEYVAFDIFDAPDTVLLDLNINFVPEHQRNLFDLVTNFGTTEHVINQMLAMRSIHDLAKSGGVIYHDLPMAGYHLHCYFVYRPAVLHDIASANRYELLFQEVSAGPWHATHRILRDLGFLEERFRDYGFEIIFKKGPAEQFSIPVDNLGSLSVSQAAWQSTQPGEIVTVAPVLPVDPRALLSRIAFRDLNAVYWSRLRRAIKDRILRNRR